MKKILISCFAVLFLVPATVAFAQSPTAKAIQAQIDALLKQISVLQQQLDSEQGQGEPGGSSGGGTIPSVPETEPTEGEVPISSPCLSLTVNLRYRTTDFQADGQVSLLQDFLQTRGYFNQEPTGFFGLLTMKAVQAFQKANGIDPTGYVGSLTRKRIKDLSCGGDGPTGETSSLFPKVIRDFKLFEIENKGDREECENIEDSSDGRASGLRGRICNKTFTAQYRREADRKVVFAALIDVTEGLHLYKAYIQKTAVKDEVGGGYSVFRIEPHEIGWYPKDGRFDIVVMQEGNYRTDSSGTTYEYPRAEGDNAVLKYYIDNYRPEFVSRPENSLKVISPNGGETGGKGEVKGFLA